MELKVIIQSDTDGTQKSVIWGLWCCVEVLEETTESKIDESDGH
jgi:hypothetical protein